MYGWQALELMKVYELERERQAEHARLVREARPRKRRFTNVAGR